MTWFRQLTLKPNEHPKVPTPAGPGSPPPPGHPLQTRPADHPSGGARVFVRWMGADGNDIGVLCITADLIVLCPFEVNRPPPS